MDLLEYNKARKENADAISTALDARKQQLGIVESEYPKNRYVDPGTIFMVLESAVKIYGYLKKPSQEGGYELSEIKAQLNAINKKLDEIIRLLEELKIYISEEFRKNAEFRLMAVFNTIGTNYKGWTLDPTNVNVIHQSNQSYINLQESSELARGYGSAHFNTIGIALFHEIMMLRFLKTPKITFQETLGSYKKYFENVRDINCEQSGTLGSRQAETNETIFQLDASTPEFAMKEIREEATYGHSDGGDKCKFIWSLRLAVSGNIYTGFTPTFETVLKEKIVIEKFTPDHDHGQKIERGSHIPSYEYEQYWDRYNRADDFYRITLAPQKATIDSTCKLCDSYIGFINEFSEMLENE